MPKLPMMKLLKKILPALLLVSVVAPIIFVATQTVYAQQGLINPQGAVINNTNPPVLTPVNGQPFIDASNPQINNSGIISGAAGPLQGPTLNGQTLDVNPTNSPNIPHASADQWSCTFSIFNFNISCLFALFTQLIYKLTSVFLALAGYLLDQSIKIGIVDLFNKTSLIGGSISKAVDTAWSAGRNLANLAFIFILLYIGISVILGLVEHGIGKMIASVVIIALLINFSLFFTEVFIDFGNILAVSIYNLFPGAKLADGSMSQAGPDIAAQFAQAFNLTTFLDGSHFGQNGFTPWHAMLTFLLGSVANVAAAVAFLSGAFTFIVRSAFLIFLMVISPFAFILYAIPHAEGQFKKWWQYLWQYTFVAPIYLFLLYSAALLANALAQAFKGNFAELINGITDPTALATSSGSSATVLVIANFIIILIFLWGCGKITKAVCDHVGVVGSGWVGAAIGGAVGGSTALALRSTAGWTGSKVAKSLQNTSFGRTRIGMQFVGASKKVAKSSFDLRAAPAIAGAIGGELGKAGGKGGYQASVDNYVKTREEYAKGFDKKPVFTDVAAKTAYEALDKQKKELQDKIKENDDTIANKMKTGDSYDAELDTRKKLNEQMKNIDGRIKEFSTNKALGQSAAAIYAENLGKRNIFTPTSWIISRRAKEAQKKIREKMKEDPNKKLKEALKEASGEEEKKDDHKDGGGGDKGAAPASGGKAPAGGGGGGGGDHH